MTSRCHASQIHHPDADASRNTTELLLQHYQDRPQDDWDRLFNCWSNFDCGDCHRSDAFCGWCALTSTCLPLPTDPLSRAFPLLTPIRYKNICSQVGERFELRTAGLGCQVSTITFLTSIATIFTTLFSILVLYSLLLCAKWIGLGLRARRGGYVVYPNDGEQLQGNIWVRKSETWGKWWRRMRGEQKEFEVEEIDGGTPKRGWVWWGGQKRDEPAEGRPLLGGDNGANRAQ